MIQAGWRFLLFALVGAGAIVLLASIGVPDAGKTVVDRHTGERVLIVRSVADALYAARDTGNAAKAAASIAEQLEAFPDEPVLVRMAAILAAETSARSAPVAPAHPEARVVRAEQERALALREELRRRAGDTWNREALVALLRDLEADEAVARATEDFFAPLARWHPQHEQGSHRPDELAARTLARLEIEAESGDADPAGQLEAYLRVIDAFRSQNRPRARFRWLLRAYAAFPDSDTVRDRLKNACLEFGRLPEAFAVLGIALQQSPEDIPLWRERARMAGWLQLPRSEIEAREFLLRDEDTVAARERLITLYRATGQPERAVVHAQAVAATTDDPALLERPARLALEAGLVDEALEILAGIAERTGDDALWRGKIVDYAWQDLRVERVIAELEGLRRRHPGNPEYEQRLEAVYRRCNLPDKLVALLDERLAREPDDALETEVLSLHAALGHDERVREIVRHRIESDADPRRFFESLRTYFALDVPGLAALARERIASDRLTAADLPVILGQLEPFRGRPGFEDLGGRLARRFPDHPLARDFLLAEIDGLPTPKERAEAAGKLADELPDRPAYLKAWIDRATWAGDLAMETVARERLRARQPEDLDNLKRLGELYGALNRPGDAVACWEAVVAQEGPGSEAALRLIDALIAAGRSEDAMVWLEKRAALPGSSLKERLQVAEQLFASEHYDRALRFYMAVLDEDPRHPLALLRAGQVRSWTNDPRGAIPFLERRLEVTGEEGAETRFFLGEAYWAIREDATARELHTRALKELQARPERDAVREMMVAKMLTRLGRGREAVPIFERVLALEPGNAEVVLDYADSMLAVGELAKARELVERARELAPGRSRLARLDGSLLLREERYEEAAEVLRGSLERFGAHAGSESERGRALELAGRTREAHDAYAQSLTLQPANVDVAEAVQRTADLVASLVHAELSHRTTGNDRVTRLWTHGSLLLPGDRTRVSARLGFAGYSGRAAAVDNGATDLEEQVGRLDLSAFFRYRRTHTIGGGLSGYPGAPGDAAFGGWAGLFWSGREPYRTLDLRVNLHELLDDPAGAVALGGRRSGLRVRGQSDFGARLWAGAELGYDALSIDRPGGGTVRGGRLRGVAGVGMRLHDGGRRVAETLPADEASLPGLDGPLLSVDPGESHGPLVNIWAVYEGIRLLGGDELATLIPIGENFDYLSAGGRADFHLARGWGAKLEASAGAELSQGELFFNLEAAATFRPSPRIEWTFSAGYGTATGRSDSTNTFSGRLALNLRW